MFDIECKAYLKLCESLDTPVSLSCALLAKYGEWDQLVEKSTDPMHYNKASDFADDYLATSVLRKNHRVPTSFNRKKNAYEKFYDSERVCAETNTRIRGFVDGAISVPPEISHVIERARDIIWQILGPLTRSKLAYAESNMRFGPGATTSVSGRDVTPSRKFTSSLHVTPRLYPYWPSLLPRMWRTAITDIKLQCASKVTCVPKDAKTDRIIAIEPHLNIYCQLGIGALVRKQLKSFGVNLDDQTRNQKLAQQALAAGLATIDLSSASDTVSRELVWLLLPLEWACLLDLPRTEYALVEGQELRLEKFSSMGNGYTFELESLIFFSLAMAATGGRGGVNAYGDDIILPAAHAPVLIDALNFLGFSVNTRKTFLAGRFYESCGMDFFDGQNVRPFFWKGQRDERAMVIYSLANSVRRYAHMRLGQLGCDVRFLPTWLYLITRLSDKDRRVRIPEGFGDGGLVSNFDEATPSKTRHGMEGYTVPAYVSVPSLRRAEPLGLLVAKMVDARRREDGINPLTTEHLPVRTVRSVLKSLQRLPSRASLGVEPQRGYQRYCKKPVLFPHWPSLGSWY
jgi:hypothetical protein